MRSSRIVIFSAVLVAMAMLPMSEQKIVVKHGHLLRKADAHYRHMGDLGLPNYRRRSNFLVKKNFFSNDPFRIPIFQSRPRFLVWNTENLKPWSTWSVCRSRSCQKIRFRQCLPKMKCPADFLVETEKCKDATGCDPQAYSATLPDFNETSCGEQPDSIKMKIVGGKDAKPHSWPWQGALHMEDEQKSAPACGATLISPQWAVTAAHCLAVSYWPKKLPRGRPFRPSQISRISVYVVFGDHNTRRRDAPEQKREVAAVVIHKRFVLRNDYCNNDVALLKLNKPIDPSVHIGAACLPPKSLHLNPRTKCTALGWGVVQVKERRSSFLDWFRPPITVRASILQEVSIPIVSYDACLRYFPSYAITRDRHLCAGEPGKDTCKGDSGGPLMCPVETKDGKKRWFLYGITSFGTQEKCGRSVGVYSRVSAFTSWMSKVQELM